MFDMGFTELIIIGAVCLLVLGPEKLPSTIRTASLMLGRLRRNFNEIRQEIEQEIGADEIRRELQNESILADLKKSSEGLRSGLEETRREISELGNQGTESAEGPARAKVQPPTEAPGTITTPAPEPAPSAESASNPSDDNKQ